MSTDDSENLRDNRRRKIEGREKRRRYVQGTRAFTHAMTNRMAKRSDKSQEPAKRPE